MRKVTYSSDYKELIENSVKNKYNADAAYKEYVSQNIREFRLRVKFDNKELSASDIASIRINSDLFTTDSFTIGSVVAETIELTIFTDTVYGSDDIYLDKSRPIIPFISLKTMVDIETALGTVTEEVWQETCLGVFYINPDGITEDGFGIISIRASALFNHPKYSNKTIDFSSKNLDLSLTRVLDIVKNVDYHNNPYFTLLNTDLPDMTMKSDNIHEKTVREVVTNIAALYGGYARTVYDEEKDRVYLEFFKMYQTDYFYDKSSYISFTRGEVSLNLKRIDCNLGENGYIWASSVSSGTGEKDTDSTSAVRIECPDMTIERLKEIIKEYDGYIYRQTTSKIFGNPLLEVGDRIKIRGRGTQAVGAEMPLQSIVYNITGSGVTMDIKSLFKATVINKAKNKESEEGDKSELEKLKEDVSKDIAELYDRTTMVEDEEDPLTIKEDYLATKEVIAGLSNKQNTLEVTLNNHINNSSGGTPGTTGGRINFVDNNNTVIGSIGPAANSFGTYQTTLVGENNRNLVLGSKNTSGLVMSAPLINLNVIGNSSTYGVMTIQENQEKDGAYIAMQSDLRMMSDTVFNGNIDIVGYTANGNYNKVTLSGSAELIGYGSQYWYATRASLGDCKLVTDIDGNGYTITNSASMNYVLAQSEHTSSLIDGGTNENIMHSNMSYDSGELRWCWKETVFTYPECDVDPETDEWIYTGRNICYIEIPIFMAENIQNDYHINISKMSWGDYRIVEKNPYYFILESQEEDFAFTFEVVAKLNDNQTLNGNAIVANDGYEVFGFEEVNED